MNGQSLVHNYFQEMKKLTLLVVGMTYAIPSPRLKLAALAEHFEVTCVTSPLRNGTAFGRSIFDFDESCQEEPISLVRLTEWPASQKFTRFLYRGLAGLLREKPFDIILVDAEPWALYKWQAWCLARRYQPRALFGEFTWENIERPGLIGWILSRVYRASARVDDFTISGNQGSRKILLKYGASGKRNLVAAQYGVDTDDFIPALPEQKSRFRQLFHLPPDAFLIGFCGRFIVEKGILDLIAAVREIRLDQAYENVHLALLGDGPLKSTITEECPPWLHVVFGQPSSVIPRFMKSVDLFALPSKPSRKGRSVWEEQFGHVLIEAMACGVPTLGSDSGAIPEVIGAPDAVFPHSDVNALVQLLLKAIEDRQWRVALGKKQRQRVEINYSHEAVARSYTDFFLEMLELKKNLASQA
jgi:glycosyltransferase involved in cell wall biosynthesis